MNTARRLEREDRSSFAMVKAGHDAACACPELSRGLHDFLRTLTRHRDASAALCVLWSPRVAVATDRETDTVSDWQRSLSSIPAPVLLRTFGLDSPGRSESEPVFVPAHALESRVRALAPALSQLPVLRDDPVVLGLRLRAGDVQRGFVVVSLRYLLSRRDVGWYAGCCDLFANAWLDRAAARVEPRPPRADAASLSPREREVATLLRAGYSVVNAAAVLGLSENTARTYVKRLYVKLGVCNRVELVLHGREGEVGR